MLALLIGAAVLIAHPAARYSLWYDEAWAALAVRSHDAGTVVETVPHNFHPPAYFLALSAWSAAAGSHNQAFAEWVGENARFWFLQTLPLDNSWVSQAVPHAEVSNVHVDAFQISLYEAP
jgi:hypothetical protein